MDILGIILSPSLEIDQTLLSYIEEKSKNQNLHFCLTAFQYLRIKEKVELTLVTSLDQGKFPSYSLVAGEEFVSSAIKMSHSFGLNQIEFWGRDLGFYSANPSLVPSAKLIQYLDYNEAKEMVMATENDLTSTAIDDLKKYQIVFSYQSLKTPHMKGTIISNRSETDAPQVKMLTLKQDITTVSIQSTAMAKKPGFLAQIFSCFSALNLSIDHVATTEDQLTLTIDSKSKDRFEERLSELQELLSPIGKVSIHSARCALSLLGNKVKSSWHKMAPVFSLLEEHPVYMMSYGEADINMTIVLDPEQAVRLMKAFHAELVEGDVVNPVFGMSWSQIEHKEEIIDLTNSKLPWWFDRQEELVNLAKQSSEPLYVYNLGTVRERARQLKTLRPIDQILFAIKANNNPDILKVVEQEGHGFECVSLQEVKHVLKHFPKIDPKRILFTPNFSPRSEYQEALKLGVNLTLDSTFPLEAWPEVFKNAEVFVRIDTGIGKGHHHYVHTAGNQSKFGVPPHEMQKLLALCHEHQVKITGLHAHAGSGILTPDAWNKVGRYLFSILPQFPHVRVIDLGGGLGVPEKLGQDSLALEAVEQSLLEFKEQAPQIKLWMEPGRFFVAESGVILAHVTQVKKKGDVQYVGIDTGMNSLIRPALYGAHHEIKNLSRLSDQNHYQANIVGPICESGDVLGRSRPLPKATSSGDIILIGTAGAYGRVMSSQYTMRMPATEVTLKE